jgi:hypothetical protein
MSKKQPLVFEIEIRPACSGNDPPFIVTMPDGAKHRIVIFDADLSWQRLPSALELALCSAIYQVLFNRAVAVRERASLVVGAKKEPSAVDIARGAPRPLREAAE